MVLETVITQTFRDRFALTTLSTQEAGAKHWLIFVKHVMQTGSYLLFTLQDLPPSLDKVRSAETRLLYFAAYLSKDYPPSTVAEYISHVKARHFFWLQFHEGRFTFC